MVFTNEQLKWMYSSDRIKEEWKKITEDILKIEWTDISDKLWKWTVKILAENWIRNEEQIKALWYDKCAEYIKNPLALKAFKNYYETLI